MPRMHHNIITGLTIEVLEERAMRMILLKEISKI
jgi:hypothetical protein